MANFRVIKASTTEAGVVADATMAEVSVQVPVDGPTNTQLWLLDVTAALNDAGDDLDVTVEGSLDNTNWFEVLSFVQVQGEGSAIQHYAPIQPLGNSTEFTGAGVVSPGSSINVFANYYRVRWTITEDEGNASFTFSVGVYYN